jgi:solute carrier family 13 (sodium-dependent dicarboxylate transporter), member 2/3/5
MGTTTRPSDAPLPLLGEAGGPRANSSRSGLLRPLASLLSVAVVIAVARLSLRDPILSRAAMIAGTCLVLWLSEVIPLYATTLVLWVGTVLLLGPLDAKAFSLSRVLGGAVSPVLVLFFGGFVLSVAGAKYGVDANIAAWMIKVSGGRRRTLLFTTMAVTSVLSMWMLNTAAAAMMLVTLRPLFAKDAGGRSFRTAMLIGLALGANFGGIGTPIGTGPNVIAVGAVASRYKLGFLHWMAFGVPIAAVMISLAYLMLVRIYRVSGSVDVAEVPHRPLSSKGWCVVAIFCATVTAWLLEPLHGIPAAVTALATASVLFGTRLLDAPDLRAIGWDTLLLIAGGLTLGQVFDDSGLAKALANATNWGGWHPTAVLFGLILACALVSAVSSNTAAAAVMIQIATSVSASPATAVLVALGASMGVPFVISTPPNAMVYGEGGLRPRDLMIPGVILMAVGCLALAMVGPSVLRWAGIP